MLLRRTPHVAPLRRRWTVQVIGRWWAWRRCYSTVSFDHRRQQFIKVSKSQKSDGSGVNNNNNNNNNNNMARGHSKRMPKWVTYSTWPLYWAHVLPRHMWNVTSVFSSGLCGNVSCFRIWTSSQGRTNSIQTAQPPDLQQELIKSFHERILK